MCHPLPWLLCKHGRIVIGSGTVRVAALVQHREESAVTLTPGWERLAMGIEVLSQATPFEPAKPEDSQELWEALIELLATPVALAGDELHDLWTAATLSKLYKALDTDLRICRLWGGNPDPRKPEPGIPTVVVASIQTLSGRVGSPGLEWLIKCRMMVVDECHHAITKSYTNVLRWLGAEERRPGAPERDEPAIIGLSATPFRGIDEAETKWLANRFDNKLLPSNPGSLYAKLHDEHVLALEEYESLDLPTRLPSALKKKLEELAEQIASDEMPEGIDLLEEINQKLALDEDRNEALLKCLRSQIDEHPQTSVLFFSNSVLHAEEMAARLHLKGIPAAAISGGTPSAARRAFLEKFKSGQIKVLCNHSVLTTGFDAPKTDMILIARQVISRVRYMQMVGRGLRGPKNGGTERCKIVTVHDNLGRFDNSRHWEYCQNLWASKS